MSQFRLLVVDDDPDTQLILSKILELEYEVVLADNGLDALGKIKSVEPDLVLADVAMPVMNGWEFVERLREMQEYKTMPVVFLSAMAQKENIKEGYERGADLYLIKPVDPDRLLRMIRMKLEERNLTPSIKTKTLEQLNGPEEPEAPVAPAQPDPQKADVVPRILIVDDDEDMRKVMQLELERWFEVVTAEDGLEAMDKALHWRPDLFVIDWMLPKVSGYQMVEILRRTQEFKFSPIIFVSAKSSAKDKKMVDRLDVSEFLTKPFMPAELSKVIKAEIDKPGFVINGTRPELGRRIHGENQGEAIDWQN